MTIPTKTSKSEPRKQPSKAKKIDQISEKNSKKNKAPSSTKSVPSKKVKYQLEDAKVEKVQKKKTRSSDTINISKKTSLKKVNSSTELKHKSSSPSLTTKNATKKSKQTSNAAIITTSNATKTAISVKKREKTDPQKQAVRATVEKKSSTKKLKKQSSAHTLPSPSPPPSTPIPAKRPPLKQCVSIATSTAIGIDMSTQTDPIVEAQLIKPAYQNHYLDVRDLVPVGALKITLEELMDSMRIVENQRAAITIKKQATLKSKIRKALKSIKI